MDEMMRYAGAMLLGGTSLPVALGLGWLALRGIFGAMPGASRVAARVGMSARRPEREESEMRVALGGERAA